MSDIDKLFEEICEAPSDNNEHCPVLRDLAFSCSSVTEFGVMFGRSTISFLAARPESLKSYDIDKKPSITVLEKIAKDLPTNFQFYLANDLEIEIEETDLLYIDTDHTYDQLRAELFKHGNKAQKFIVLHDTTAFPEMWTAVEEFMKEHPFRLRAKYENNNGLAVLERI